MPLLKPFKEETAPVKYLPGEKFTRLKINSRTPYLISTKGRIYSFYKDRILCGRLASGSRVFDYAATDDGKPPPYAFKDGLIKPDARGRVNITFQRLVAITFFKMPKGRGFIVVHKDYNNQNNAVENLEVYPIKKGFSYSRASPRYKVTREKGHKLNAGHVRKIKHLLKEKRAGLNSLTVAQIAKIFDVHEMQIYRIQNGDLWRHAGPSVKKKEKPKTLDKKTVAAIRKEIAAGRPGVQIAAMFKTTATTISRIKQNKTYK